MKTKNKKTFKGIPVRVYEIIVTRAKPDEDFLETIDKRKTKGYEFPGAYEILMDSWKEKDNVSE